MQPQELGTAPSRGFYAEYNGKKGQWGIYDSSRKRRRWVSCSETADEYVALLNAGLPLPGSRKTKSKAETELLGLVADGSNSEPASKRRRTSVNYADHTTRTGAYKAGLGRGKTTYEAVEEGELVQPSTAQLLLLQPKSKTERNLQAALRNEIVEHKGTKRKLHSATQELSFAQALLLHLPASFSLGRTLRDSLIGNHSRGENT